MPIISYDIPNYGQARTNGECEDERDNALQTCAETAYVEAAICGLAAPTLILGLACGVGVVALDAVCHNAAERDYETCKKYE